MAQNFPDSPVLNDLATVNGIVYKWNGFAWDIVQSAGANVTISDNAPSAPSVGDLWWESDVGRLKVYYNDGVTSQWVDASPSSSGISLTNLSIGSEGVASGDGSLGYDNTTGVFTYTPPDLSSYLTATLDADIDLNGNSIVDSTLAGFVTSNLRTFETKIQLGGDSDADTYGYAIGQEAQAGIYDVTIGAYAGKNKKTTNNNYSIGIGAFAQQNSNPGDETGTGAIAIGVLAGDANQGENALALGRYAGRNNQATKSIVINATGSDLENITANSCVVKPIRNAAGTHGLEYDPASGEITYDTLSSGGISDSITEGNSSVEVTDTGSDGHIDLTTEGTLRWEITSTGHLLPSTNEDYDIGSASRKVRHLFLSDNSLYFVDSSDNERVLNVNSDGKIVFDGSNIADRSSEVPSNGAVIDLNKTNHFVSPGESYVLEDGTYTGQELSFWKQVGVGYPEINVSNALWTSTGNSTGIESSFVWRLSGDYVGKFSCVWNGAQWCLSSGETGV